MAIRPVEELVTDRTLQDVLRNTTKGNYNASDLNRIEKWSRYLADTLIENGYYIVIETKTDWEIGLGKDKMTTEINRIKTNLQKLKDRFYVLSTTPAVPSTSDVSINYMKANDIEKIMVDIDNIITWLLDGLKYTNTFYAGQSLSPFNTIY